MKVKTRKCTKCGKEKEETEVNFYRRAKGRDGFQSECKICYVERSRNKTGYQWEKLWVG